jgi:hypothetical protein
MEDPSIASSAVNRTVLTKKMPAGFTLILCIDASGPVIRSFRSDLPAECAPLANAGNQILSKHSVLRFEPGLIINYDKI